MAIVKDKPIFTPQQTTRLHILLKRHKGALGSYKSLVPFEQPVVFLIRNGKVEFHEGIKGNRWKVPDDDNGRVINLGTNLLEFEYGKDTFKGYICNIDEAFPLPQKPKVYSELMELIIRKIITNYKNLETTAGEMRKTMWAVFFMLIIAAIVYVFFLRGKLGPETVTAANQTAAAAIQNMTSIPTQIA